MGTKAGTWQRVSTSGQDEASQLPDLTRWCDQHDYTVAERYVLHGKSASKGKQDAALDQVIRDMQDGKITVLVVWQSSRIERRGAYSVFDLARRVREAGGRIEYVKDAYLNETNEMSDVMLALAATRDRQKSRDISLQVTAKQTALRAAGSVVGRAPWGYEIAKLDGRKIFAPTATGRTFVPVIFQMIIDGNSLRTVAAYLTAEGVPTGTGGPVWNEGFIGNRLVRNPVYYGQRRNGGELETEPLVSLSVWQEANAKLSSRARPGRSTVRHDKALLSPECGNPDCRKIRQELAGKDVVVSETSPMYRVQTGKDRAEYYRCAGRGPQRRGCGNMVRLADLDERVTELMTEDHANDHRERVFIAGDDRSDVAKLRSAAMAAYERGDKVRFLELDAQADARDSSAAVLPHWEETATGQTEGQFFTALDATGRRAELAAHWSVSAHRASDGEVIVSVGPRWAA